MTTFVCLEGGLQGHVHTSMYILSGARAYCLGSQLLNIGLGPWACWGLKGASSSQVVLPLVVVVRKHKKTSCNSSSLIFPK